MDGQVLVSLIFSLPLDMSSIPLAFLQEVISETGELPFSPDIIARLGVFICNGLHDSPASTKRCCAVLLTRLFHAIPDAITELALGKMSVPDPLNLVETDDVLAMEITSLLCSVLEHAIRSGAKAQLLHQLDTSEVLEALTDMLESESACVSEMADEILDFIGVDLEGDDGVALPDSVDET